MPQATATPAALARNVSSLGGRNTDLAARLDGTPPRADLAFAETPQGVPALTAGGTLLCSRHRPLDEAERLAGRADVVAHAVFVVLGFGAGYHVQRLGERLGKSGIIIVFEPDVALLRGVFERIDHSAWIEATNVVWVSDPEDRGTLGAKLQGAESVIAQGVEVLTHPASCDRLAGSAELFMATFRDYVATAKTTLLTTLMRSVDTVRNCLLNLDHYAAGSGIAELRGAASGHPAAIVSAGPSLRRNIDRLAEPGVRDRCVIVATQTTLKPLLAAGVRPHFVTALDFHEISRRFYAGLEPDDVAGVTLIAEPKAHPVILDAFPGAVRCCASSFLDELLGPHRREMGAIPAGATVAHLAVYAARHMGCDPIILVGQDLAFTDGLYYAPGTAIAEVWAPELSPFNTMEMMEWQRIVRHRSHLARRRDVHGREVYTDAQMLAYLHQFERDFAQLDGEGVTVIDATEGGLPKQHTTAMPLADALRRHAADPLPELPAARRGFDSERLAVARQRVEAIAADVAVLRDASVQSARTIRRMLEEQDDAARMEEHFRRIEQERRRVEERFEAFTLLQNLNQLGVFKRFKADRRLEVQRDLDPRARQRAQLERDLVNVAWTRDAAEEMADQLRQASELLAGRPARPPESGRARLLLRGRWRPAAEVESSGVRSEQQARIAAMVPVDPERNGLGVARSLEAAFGGRPVIQATLERLGRSGELASIVLLVPADAVARIERLLDRTRIGVPVEIEPTEGSPFGPERRAVAAARAWSPTAWRGGIAGMSVYDEVLSPGPMHRAMAKRGITAALLAAPDWPLVAVDADHGVDAVCARHRELPDHHALVFTQAPPGLGACVVGAALVEELCRRTRLATVGGLLVYQPQAPQHDPIARSANVSIDERVSRSRVRATCDSARYRSRLERVAGGGDLHTREIVARLERDWHERPDELPQHVILELTTARASRGLFRDSLGGGAQREPIAPRRARRLFEQLAVAGDAVVTLGGLGDPLLHDGFDEVIRDAREAGLHVHVRTELPAGRPILDRLLEAGPDAISVDLHADRAATYEAMMGTDRFAEVLEQIQHLVARRRRLTDHPEAAAMALPWIVPRLQRRPETLADIEPFFDRWQAFLGAAVVEGPPSSETGPGAGGTLTPAEAPARVAVDELRRRMVVFSDGSVPVSEPDLAGRRTAGNAFEVPLGELWPALCDARRRGFESGRPPVTWLP